MTRRVADVLIETLQAAGVKTCYGIVGDTLNQIAHAIDRRVRVSGFTYTPRNAHARTLWVFTELAKSGSEGQSLRSSLTDRERDVATLLIEGKTGKEVARALGISPRTVDIYRTRLLRKYNASNTGELITLLLAG